MRGFFFSKITRHMPRQSHQEKFFEVKAHCMTYPGRNCGSSVASFPGKARWAEIAICQLSFVGPTSVSVSRWLPLHLSRRLAGEGRLSGSAAAVITRAATVTSRRAPARWRTGVAVAGRRGGRWRGRGEGRLAGGGIGRRRRIRWENLGEFSRHPILRFSSLSVRPAIPQCSNFTVQDKSLCWCRTQLEFFRFAAVFFFGFPDRCARFCRLVRNTRGMDNTPRFSGGGDDCELMQQKQEWAKYTLRTIHQSRGVSSHLMLVFSCAVEHKTC